MQTPVLVTDLSDNLQNGLGSLVYLPKITVPFTSVTNRAQCVDPSNDLMPKFGIGRTMFQAIEEVQGEFGPTGQPIYKPINDTNDHVRFAGAWVSGAGIYGECAAYSASTTGDFMEITFYGTGLNLLALMFTNYSMTASVDGGSSGSNIFPASPNLLLSGRQYSSNQVIPVASGLSLGIHTVKLTISATGSTPVIYGYESVNANTSLQYVPGIMYSSGKRLYNPTLTTDPYGSNFASGTLGTKGGHVAVYQTSNGVLAKAVNPVDTTALYLNSSSHSNESIVRAYSFREFGCGRSDDFSLLGITQLALAFTLDDGSTSLVCGQAVLDTNYSGDQFYSQGSTTSYTFVFVGTGLDLLLNTDATSSTRTDTVSIDGTTVGTFTPPANSIKYIQKICSGLPYGSHIVKITSASGSSTNRVQRFITYGTSLPAIPSGSVLVADYYLMANYVFDATASQTDVSTGVLCKAWARELLYSGTWSVGSFNSFRYGTYASSTATGSSVSFTFFGTGVEAVLDEGSGAASVTVQMDGSAYTGAASITAAGGSTWTPATSTAVLGSDEIRLSITGLTLGVHTIKITYASGSTFFGVHGFDVITPVHSPKGNLPGDLQNTQTVGSQAITDQRKLSTQTVKQILNWDTAVGIVNSPTIALAAGGVPMPDMTCVVKTTGNPLLIAFSAAILAEPGPYAYTFLMVDGVAVGSAAKYGGPGSGTSNQATIFADTFIYPVAAGTHIVQVFWGAAGGGAIAQAYTTMRNLSVMEII